MRLRDGMPVQLVNIYGTTPGVLVLDAWERKYGGPGYGVHTIRLADGSLFRTEGRLVPAEMHSHETQNSI